MRRNMSLIQLLVLCSALNGLQMMLCQTKSHLRVLSRVLPECVHALVIRHRADFFDSPSKSLQAYLEFIFVAVFQTNQVNAFVYAGFGICHVHTYIGYSKGMRTLIHKKKMSG